MADAEGVTMRRRSMSDTGAGPTRCTRRPRDPLRPASATRHRLPLTKGRRRSNVVRAGLSHLGNLGLYVLPKPSGGFQGVPLFDP
jgi:hypothetical protein